ncbi:MAG: hypothetical protein NVS3B20_04200 [Polyangiales bacterium]
MRHLSIITALVLLLGGFACSSAHTRQGEADTGRTDAGVGDAPLIDADVAIAAPLRNEAGFIEVPPHSRMFYVFAPASEQPQRKPLVVLFNGGPGSPVSRWLLLWGTGNFTLDPTTMSRVPLENPARWTSFANTLYLDQRHTGFSYGTKGDTCVSSPELDAVDFTRAVLRFLKMHPVIRKNKVIIAGESYGGIRANLMLHFLLRYAMGTTQFAPGLKEEIQEHYDAVFPDLRGNFASAVRAATQFVGLILLEPYVLGRDQELAEDALAKTDPDYPADIPGRDGYDLSKPRGFTETLARMAISALADRDSFSRLVGVEAASIRLLQPSARLDGVHFGGGDILDAPLNASLTAQLGGLSPGDSYFVGFGGCFRFDPSRLQVAIEAFLSNLHDVRIFLTRARYDGAIYSPAILAALRTKALLEVTVDEGPRPGVARPGWFRVGGWAPPLSAKTIEVRYPRYEFSGHMISVTEPLELSQDVQGWLREVVAP